MRIVAGATKKGFEGKGLQKRLRTRFLEMAEESGKYDRVLVETISPATEHIWKNRFGFHYLSKAAFAEFKTKTGERPLEGVEGNAAILEKVLRSNPVQDLGCWCPFISCGFLCQALCRPKLKRRLRPKTEDLTKVGPVE